ncbi:MAG: VWA domain-containing protein [Balneolaceae bacterium]|nr:VWA domain-containing protein [Balneolaceae bacterium]
MIWSNPHLAWLLLLIPALIAGLWWYRKQVRERREQYFSDSLFSKLRRGYWELGDRIRMIALYTGMAFLVIAMAGPKVGTEVKEVKRQGVDLLIALDLSASMNAEDVKPSRLEKAKYEITRLIDRLQGDRVGLVVYTGDAFLQAPMTLDYSALRLFLSIAETDQMPNTSTDFSAALSTAQQAFASIEQEGGNGSRAAKVMLIISDGENHGAGYEEELNTLVENNISIYTLGIGTVEGATIPIYGDNGSLIGYKRDEQGQVVTSQLEPEVLQDIARQGNGSYYEIRTGSAGIDPFLGRLDELEKGEFASQEYADFKNRYQLLAAIGLVFVVVSMVMNNYRETG